MKLNKYKFKEALRFLIPAISREEHRKSLTHLHVQCKHGVYSLTSANAYVIKRVNFRTSGINEYIHENSFLVPLKTLTTFNTMLGRIRKKDDRETVEISFKTLKYVDLSINYPRLEYQYPDIDYLIRGVSKKDGNTIYKTGSTPYHDTGIDMSQMKLVTEGAPERLCFKTQYCGPTEPIRFVDKDDTYSAVIMPIKIQW